MRVHATSGKPERIARVESGEFAFGPQILPGAARRPLQSLERGRVSIDGTEAPSWSSHSVRASGIPLIEGGSDGRYVPVTDTTGYLLYSTWPESSLQRRSTSSDSRQQPTPDLCSKASDVPPRKRRRTTHMAVSAHRHARLFSGAAWHHSRAAFELLDRTGSVEIVKVAARARISRHASPRTAGRSSLARMTARTPAISIYDVSGKSLMRRLTFGGSYWIPRLVARRPTHRVPIRSRRHSRDLPAARRRKRCG